MYKVTFSKQADKQLCKLDKSVAKKIVAWIVKNLQNCEDPRLHGKALTGNRAGLWRYRIGDYRIIAKIFDNELIIQVIEVGHRREIYE